MKLRALDTPGRGGQDEPGVLRERKRGRVALRAIGRAVREQRANATVATFGEIRRSLRDGDLLLFRGTGWLSMIIRAITRSPYSHAGVIYTFDRNVYCIEAVGAGVRIIHLSELIKRYHGQIDYFEVQASQAQRKRAVAFCFRQLGKFYDKMGLFRYALAIVLDKKAASPQDDQWFCSELVAAAYSTQGVPLTAEQEAYTSPSDLAVSPRVKLVCTLKESPGDDDETDSDGSASGEGLGPEGIGLSVDQM